MRDLNANELEAVNGGFLRRVVIIVVDIIATAIEHAENAPPISDAHVKGSK